MFFAPQPDESQTLRLTERNRTKGAAGLLVAHVAHPASSRNLVPLRATCWTVTAGMRVTLAVTLGALALLVPAAGYARPAAISPRVAVTARAARRVSAVSRSPSSTPLASRAAPSSSQRQQRAAPAPAHPSDPPPATDADPAELGLRVRDDGALVSSCGRVLIDRLGDDVTSAGATHGAVVLGWKEGRDAPAKSQSTHTLGWLNADRFLAASRVKRWWMGPLVCRRGGRVPIETQFLLARCPAAEGARRGGGAGGGGAEPLYAVIIPLIDGAFRTTLCGNILSNELLLRTDSGDKDVCARRVGSAAVVAVGAEPYATLRRAFAAASEHLGTFRVRGAKPLPDHLDMFGWCTWDAFYSGVEPSGILRGVRTLREGGAPPRFVIVDDGWQTVDAGEANRQGVAFEDADAERASPAALAQPAPSAINLAVRLVSWAYQRLVEPAPFHSQRSRLWRWLSQGPLRRNLIRFFDEHTDFSKSLVSVRANAKFESELGEGRSLRALVSQLRAELGVRRVYCWHALAGYWSGVSPVSQEMRELLKPEWRFPQPAMDLLMVEPAVAWDAASFHGVGAIGPAQFGTFYGALHAYLEEAGVDGVKVDAQSGISPFGAGFGIGAPRYVQAAVHAMEASVGRHLSRGPASARECINCMCHSSENLLSFRETAVLRAGDDFYPRDDASHAAHIATVSYNSVFLGEIGACDWDMFQSALPSASLHAAARAVGGGAIYVSDHPGAHDFGLLRQLVLPDGRTLRATHAGRCARARERRPRGGAAGRARALARSHARAPRPAPRALSVPQADARLPLRGRVARRAQRAQDLERQRAHRPHRRVQRAGLRVEPAAAAVCRAARAASRAAQPAAERLRGAALPAGRRGGLGRVRALAVHDGRADRPARRGGRARRGAARLERVGGLHRLPTAALGGRGGRRGGGHALGGARAARDDERRRRHRRRARLAGLRDGARHRPRHLRPVRRARALVRGGGRRAGGAHLRQRHRRARARARAEGRRRRRGGGRGGAIRCEERAARDRRALPEAARVRLAVRRARLVRPIHRLIPC